MKKGLLTVLAASLVFVGCQNYDDQFDDLNAQISALKSQVDGLGALSGQVASISGTIAGLQSGIAAASASAAAANSAASAIDLSGLSASLTTLQAEVDAINAAIATTATAAEVTALQTSLTQVENDLADLLVSNNVYSTAITINSAATMASALALGNKVALMNAAVDITDDATIADTDIQTFIDRIKTTTAGFRYDSGSTTGYAPTFNEMVSATTFDIESAGPISANKLASATVVTIVSSYTSKITSVDLGAMASVTTISSGTDGSETANNLTLASATNIDLGALTMYNVDSAADVLTISMKKGGTLDIGSLTGTERTTNLEEPLSLTISGPASLSVSKIADGTMTVSDVASLTVSGFYGTLDVNSGVETLTTTDAVTLALDGAVDVVTATLDFAYDWDPSLTTAQAAVADDLRNTDYLMDIAAAGDWVATDLKTLTVTGHLLDLHLNEGNLETLSIDATMHDLTLDSNTDLTSLTVASTAKIGNITMTANNNLEVADFNHTTNLNNKLSGATAGTSTNSANLSVNFSATNNTALTKLHSTGDDVGHLTVTGNTALAELDFTGLADDGGDLTPAANVYNNNLTATSASNTSDGDTDVADGTAGTDLGSFDDGTSGMDTLKTYLTHVVADSDFAGYVSFDTLSTETDTETAGTSTVTLNVTYQNNTTFNEATVLYEVAASAGTTTTTGGAATKGKRGLLIDISTAGKIDFWAGGSQILDIDGDGAPAAYTITGSTAAQIVTNLNNSNNLTRATNNGVTFLASEGGNSTVAVHLGGSTLNSALYETSNITASAFALGTQESITLTVGNLSVTAAVAGTESAGTDAYQVADKLVTTLRTAVAAALAGDSANYYEVTVGAVISSTLAGAAEDAAALLFTSKDIGTGGAGLAATISVSGRSSGAFVPYAIGPSKATNDNSTAGIDVVVTFEDVDAGTTLYTLGTPANDATDHAWSAATVSYVANNGATGINELYTTHYANAGTADETGTNTYPAESRSDVRNPEDDNTESITTGAVTAIAKNRIAWLG